MARFRKRPVVVEAVQYTGDCLPAGVCVGASYKPGWQHPSQPCLQYAHVHTLEGPVVASFGDWIITGVKGERYPCKPEVFALTYEPVVGVEDA